MIAFAIQHIILDLDSNLSYLKTVPPLKTPKKKLVFKIKIIHKYLKFKICIAQARYKKYANQKRKLAYKFYISQKIWLNSKNIKIARPQKSSSEKILGLG
jgi:hypothetical protein